MRLTKVSAGFWVLNSEQDFLFSHLYWELFQENLLGTCNFASLLWFDVSWW